MGKFAISEFKIRFRQGDPAKIMFFGEVFNLAHDAFEDFIVDAKIDWGQWFENKDWIMPLKKAEADYHSPFRPGMKVTVKTHIKELRQTSFLVEYNFLNGSEPLATVRTLHVCVDSKTKQKQPIPDALRNLLEVYLHG